MRRGADRGFANAPDHGEARGCCSACAIGADPRSKYGADFLPRNAKIESWSRFLWCPQTTKKVAYCIRDQIVVPVLLITEKIVDDVFVLSQERVQNRATYTIILMTSACTVDNVGFIKGLDKYNMPRPGDVMVPVPRINQGTVPVTQHVPQEPIELVPAGDVEQVVSWLGSSTGRAFVPFSGKVLEPQQPLRAQTLLSRCCRSSGGWSSSWTKLLTCPVLCSSGCGRDGNCGGSAVAVH